MSIMLDSETKVMIQGITGRTARVHLQYMLDYGTRVVCGVSRSSGEAMIGRIPVYPTVGDALQKHEVDLTVLFIGALQVKVAALEAIEHEVPLLFILADGVPLHDTCEILTKATEAGVRVVGPNSQGMISPGKAKIGGTGGAEPWRIFLPGPVGILSRSGGMGVEIAMMLKQRGFGQSSYVAVGGDLMIGSDFADLMLLLQKDSDTECIVLFGEPGTRQEEEAARLVSSETVTKPVVAFVAGESLEHLPQGLNFGHTAALTGQSSGNAREKRSLLREAGALVAERLDDVPELVRRCLPGR